MSQADEHDTLPPSMDPAADGGIVEPPRGAWGIVRRLGPGLIIAASIVGSGELIATTKTGAQAGIALLWLILIGCLIKVFAQIELGRFTISHGETTLAAVDRVPGPRLVANWIVWAWLAMMVCTTGQLGGIVGGVGQALAVSFPLEGDYAAVVQVPSEEDIRAYITRHDTATSLTESTDAEQQRARRGDEFTARRLKAAGARGDEALAAVRELMRVEPNKSTPPSAAAIAAQERVDALLAPYTHDDKYWAAIISIITTLLLARGRYGLIQHLSTVLVVAFTFLTVGNVVSLQLRDEWRISADEFLRGLSFGLPQGDSPWDALGTALATFGIIGVGATELITYPYWCLEKGYAKFAGPRDDSPAWAARARGWMRVMHYDAFLSMVIYTAATLAFFLMGVSVLHRLSLNPDDQRMVSTLAEAYVPIFGEYARWLFLAGAFAVLYSTFLVASAGNARMLADGMKLFGLIDRHRQRTHERTVAIWSMIVPLLCGAIYAAIPSPVKLVLLAGVAQATMLPMLGLAAIYLRYCCTDPRLRPSRLWDACLVLSFLGLLLAGGWGIYASAIKFAS